MEFNDKLRIQGFGITDAVFESLPESERAIIECCAQHGDDKMAHIMLRAMYAHPENQAARLYYGAHVDDKYACLLLGSYHLHGKFVFAQNTALACHFLEQALDGTDWIKASAERELRCLHAPTKDMELSGYTLVRYRGSDQDVTVPYMVKEIGANAFRGNITLRKVEFPRCLTHIGSFAFDSCKNLQDVLLPNGITTIGACAFSSCNSLREIDLPDTLQTLGNMAFSLCKGLEKVNLYSRGAHIGKEAFTYSSVKTADIRGAWWIGKGAFAHTPLESIVIGEALHTVEANAFKDCPKLEVVYQMHNSHYIRRNITIEHGNAAFIGAPLRMLVLREENRKITFGREEIEAESSMLENVPFLPSREKESGYSTGLYNDASGPSIWVF